MNIKSPKVTVLMPVYNVASYVREAIDSILNQTLSDFELLIINDGSTDNTRDEILKISDSRIKFIENDKNIGLANTLNIGLELATGEYVARMDGDDISLPERLEKQLAVLEQNRDIDICGASYEFFGFRNYKVIYPEQHEQIKVGLLFGCCMIIPMFRKQSVLTAGLRYNQVYFPAEDYRFWTECMLKGLKMYNIQEILFRYRMHASQVSELMVNQPAMTINVQKKYADDLFQNWNKQIVEDFKNCFYTNKSIELLEDIYRIQSTSSELLKENNTVHVFENKMFNVQLKKILSSSAALFVTHYWFRNKYNIIDLFKLIYSGIYFMLAPKFRFKLLIKSLLFMKKN